ncbi:MAG: hypothetical protein WBP41_10165, partial [Saprospiraceae bacterium]
MIRSIQILILTLVIYNTGLAQNHLPQPICQLLITTIPYNNDSLNVPAYFFNNGSYDIETPPELLRYSYSSDPNDSIRILTCGSPVNNFFEIYVFDEEGAYDFCTVVLNLTHDYCDTVSTSLTDTMSPSLFVYDKFIPTLPDSNFPTCLMAKDFVIYGYDNNDVSNQSVQYSFSTEEVDTVRCYTCKDVGQYQISIYASDTVGNQIHVPLLIRVVANAGCDQMLD